MTNGLVASSGGVLRGCDWRVSRLLSARAADREHLAAVLADVPLTMNRVGTSKIMRRTGASKPSVWRWQEHCPEAIVNVLLHDKTRRSGVPLMASSTVSDVTRRTHNPQQPGRETSQLIVRESLALNVGMYDPLEVNSWSVR